MGRRDWRIDVGFDIDDVLYPWHATAHKLCVEAGIANGVQAKTWTPYHEYDCTREEWLAVLGEGALTGRLYYAAPFGGVVEQIERIACQGEARIRLITARGGFQHGELIKEHTRQWVRDHGIIHHSLNFGKDKTIQKTHFFIDDNIENYDAIHATMRTKVFLLNRPWNQIPGGDDRRRVNSVKEYVNNIFAGEESNDDQAHG